MSSPWQAVRRPNSLGRRIARLALASVYLAAGVIHVGDPGVFLAVMPDIVPYPRDVIIGTGICEIAGAAGLLIPRFRRAAGFALALYAVCVFPVNIKHAMLQLPIDGMRLGWWYHAPRLLFQPVFVWWALVAGCVL